MNQRIPLIAGNWKMHKTCEEALASAEKLKSLVGEVFLDIDVMIAPAFTSLYPVSEKLKGTGIKTGGQNLFWKENGAYTGEISAKMLKSAGCKYVIIGHSERRHIFAESDSEINMKIKAAIEEKLIPVFCIGETESERNNGQTFIVLDTQITNGLQGLPVSTMDSIVIAYEPVWAIGTGKTATTETVEEVHVWIRSFLEKKINADLAGSTRILYGGSVNSDNISELMSLNNVDGVLVGGASLDPDSFFRIINYKK